MVRTSTVYCTWDIHGCISHLDGLQSVFIIIVQGIQNSTQNPEWLSCPPMGTKRYFPYIKYIIHYILSTRYHGCEKENFLLITLIMKSKVFFVNIVML